MDRVVLIAGPSCVGKTTFVNKLRSGEMPEITQALDLEPLADWQYRDSYYADEAMSQELVKQSVDKLFLHWTVAYPSLKVSLRRFLAGGSYEKAARLKLLQNATRIDCLVLRARQESLLARVKMREEVVLARRAARKDSYWLFREKMANVKALESLYADSARLEALYREWVVFCRDVPVSAIYEVDVSANTPITVIPMPENYPPVE